MKKRNKLAALFEGKTPKSKVVFDALLERLPEEPNIAWYPSAGLDFKDLIEVNRTSVIPDLHIHTDYSTSFKNLKVGEIFKDNLATISITTIEEIKFAKPVKFFANPKFVHFLMEDTEEPLIFLLEVLIVSNKQTIKKPVLYVVMENINFLDEILLKEQLPISHFIKVREGCGFGGNRKSISIVYAFLADLKTKYLLVDTEEHTDFYLIKHLARKHKIQFKNYDLKNISQRSNIANWSDFNVKVLQVVKVNCKESQSMDDNRIKELLGIIKTDVKIKTRVLIEKIFTAKYKTIKVKDINFCYHEYQSCSSIFIELLLPDNFGQFSVTDIDKFELLYFNWIERTATVTLAFENIDQLERVFLEVKNQYWKG
ncbi:DUF7663 domain-containing protein [Tenacibaculum finnmarkense]|uniref:DUF7663 domain-containing protein n=2 Tax=Tenacibaculum finnmarkense TaxID=2781243 RepID=UPI001E4C5DD5|nr:hypothetical protein [Tenacibaculum finnmarkense]MCD8445151.1 hypothetical protein [Tenacibaculum finnmarkense genomovar ulcerans]MCG8748974.1 hypothetical protein [Tenacibaculum finnmarkense]